MNKVKIALLGGFWLLNGCFEPDIYTQISDSTYIRHSPKTVHMIDLSGKVHSKIEESDAALVHIEIDVHYAHCSNPQSRSLGGGADGYIRVTAKQENKIIARSQCDFRGQPKTEEIQRVYDTLLERLEWNIAP